MGNLINGNLANENIPEYNNYFSNVQNLTVAEKNKKYIIKNINTNDEEIKNFIFTLGCYKGEEITVLSVLSENYIISVNDAKYSIDRDLAEVIQI